MTDLPLPAEPREPSLVSRNTGKPLLTDRDLGTFFAFCNRGELSEALALVEGSHWPTYTENALAAGKLRTVMEDRGRWFERLGRRTLPTWHPNDRWPQGVFLYQYPDGSYQLVTSGDWPRLVIS